MTIKEEAKHRAETTMALKDVHLDKMTKADFKEPIQNALYATGKFTTDECETLSEGIQQYINESGLLDELLREREDEAYNQGRADEYNDLDLP